MPACTYVPTSGRTVSILIDFFDCQARTIGAAGFQTLAAPGATASLLLTALLTIVVALFGFRLLLDETPTMRDLVLALVKVGIVLALATSWPAYRTLLYDVVIQGPRQLAAELSGPLDLPGSDGSLGRRLDTIDGQFQTLEALGTGRYVAETATLDQGGLATSGFDRLALSLSRTAFLLTSVGALALLSLSAGLLLALGPIFLAFLLFAATRGLVEGWLRALIAVPLAMVMTIITLGVDLAVLEPWMADLVGRRAGGEAIGIAMTPLLATVTLFGIVSAGLLLLCLRIGLSLRFPIGNRRQTILVGQMAALPSAQMPGPQQPTTVDTVGPTRAHLIADSIAATQRREEHLHQAAAAASPRSPVSVAQPAFGSDRVNTPVPLGQSFRRTTRRVSSSARVRDLRS